MSKRFLDLQKRMDEINDHANRFFKTLTQRRAEAIKLIRENPNEHNSFGALRPPPRDFYFEGSQEVMNVLRGDLRRTMTDITEILARSPAITSVDINDIVRHTRILDAALALQQYGVGDQRPPDGEAKVAEQNAPSDAQRVDAETIDEVKRRFETAFVSIRAFYDYATASESLPEENLVVGKSRLIKRNTAFIIMRIDNAAITRDVHSTVKRVFSNFGIKAIRADDIEHEGKITERILHEIRTSEYLFADLTGERPSVYYEVGYAHALGLEPIMYRNLSDEEIHFDLKDYNCPTYEGVVDLEQKLSGRLQAKVTEWSTTLHDQPATQS